MKNLFFIFVFFFTLHSDLLDDILSKVGKTKQNLGYSPLKFWSRYPHPSQIPLILYYFDDLFKNPLSLYEFTKTMGNACTLYLSENNYKKENFLYHLLYNLGVDKKIVGFRNYSANLIEYPDIGLVSALVKLNQEFFPQLNTVSFGGKYEPEKEIKKEIDKIPVSLQLLFSELIFNYIDAYTWWKIGVRNLNKGEIEEIYKIRDLDETQSGGNVFYSVLDDVSDLIDEHSLYYCALKLSYAIGRFSYKYDSIIKKENSFKNSFFLEFETPKGKICFSKGRNDTYNEKYIIVVDIDGDDIYNGYYATGSSETPLSFVIDIGGNDNYRTDEFYGSQGAGIGGIGILFDKQGDDIYSAKKGSQGFGIYGAGILFDGSGNDKYNSWTLTQGCGIFGIGLFIDREGDDSYYIYGNGQGNGEMGGIGIMLDYSGDDIYKSEPYSNIFDRGDYHSEYKINVSAAQGYGGGRRGDGSDGHSYAGGLGCLIDIKGNDKYISGNFSQGTGYWYGIGILFDGEGDDIYSSCYFTQASGAHYAIGVLMDENGNDNHTLFETAGAGLSFGWDFAITLFLDKEGNDFYSAKKISIGVSQIRSNSFFFDLKGNDVYKIPSNTLKLGESDFQTGYKFPHPVSPYIHFTHTSSFGIFLDADGNDKYEIEGEKSSVYKNNSEWFSPESSDTTYGFENFGIGIDTEKGKGIVKEFEIYE